VPVDPISWLVFSEMRISKELIDDFLVGVFTRIGQKRLGLGDGRRKTRQIERHTSQQGGLIGFSRWCQSFFFQPRQDEMINRGLAPVRHLDRGQGGQAGGVMMAQDSSNPACLAGASTLPLP